MDIRSLFPVRTHYSRSGGTSSLPPEHSLLWRENHLRHVREQQSIDRETVTIDGEITPDIQRALDMHVIWRIVTQSELDKLNNRFNK